MPLIIVNLHDGDLGRSNIAGHNNIGSSGTTGTRVADLLDVNGDPTGVALVQSVALSATGNASHAVSAPNADFPVEFYQSHWYPGFNATAELGKLTGLPAGASYTIKLAGNHGGSTVTNYTATDGSPSPASYDNAGQTDPVPSPVVITGTVPANGEASITFGASGYARANGLSIEYDDATGPTITNLDTDNSVTTYQQANANGVSGFGGPITSGTLGGQAVAIIDGDWQSNGGVVSLRVPGSLATGSYDLVLSDGTDSATLSGVTFTQTHPRPALYGLVDSNSLLKGQVYTSGTRFRFASSFSNGTLDLTAGDAAEWAGDIADYYTPDAGFTGEDPATLEFIYSDGTTATAVVTLRVGEGGGVVVVSAAKKKSRRRLNAYLMGRGWRSGVPLRSDDE